MKLKVSLCLILFISPLYQLFSLERIIIPSINSGVYNNDIELSFDNSLDIDILYYFNESMDKTPIKYQYPISLTAMPGESHKYSLTVFAIDEGEILAQKNFTYLIDKDLPLKAVLDSSDGIYDTTLKVKFKESKDSIYYSINSNNSKDYNLWSGEIITIPQKKELNTEFIKSYTEDSAGNRTNVTINKFTILPLENKLETINVVSPVEGSFLNSQLLYINTAGLKWIRYSFNEVDPVLRGTTYTNPVLLKKIGTFKLKVAALPLNSDKVLRKDLEFSIVGNNNIIINNDSGLYSEELNLKFTDKSMYYNLEDRKIQSDDSLLPDSISIMPVPGVIKYRTIRIGNQNDLNEYRYLFVLDKKTPAAPIISLTPNQPVAETTQVRILSVPGTDVFYTIDGSTPDRYSKFYNKPFLMEIPEGQKSGSMIIKAISYFNNKSSSEITTKLLTYDIKKPEKPEIEVLSKNLRQVEFKISNNLAHRIIYTVKYNGEIPEDPVFSSFTGNENMFLSLPYGVEQHVKMKIALIDKAGNISDPVLLDLLYSDTIPPKAPEILYSEKTVTITGSDKIFYRITNNLDKTNNNFVLYENPVSLDFKKEDFNSLKIESYCIDKQGNRSNLKISPDIIVDNRIPIFPQFSGIENNGIYNKPLYLRFYSADDIKVYYSVSQSPNTPIDPVVSDSNLVTDFIYFDCPVNESRNYTVKMIASYGIDRVTTPPVSLSFSIDRIAPRAPVISSIINNKIYKNDVNITINEKAEQVWVLIKEKINEADLNYSYFKNNGILLNTEYTLKQEDNTEKNYQIAALSMDLAGNSTISREIINFTIDKIPPKVPIIIEDKSPDNKNLLRFISDPSDEVVYEIGTNGKQPKIPDKNSAHYLLPIEINNLNQNIVYISARSIDTAGNLSNETARYKISLKTNKSTTPVISVSNISSSKFSISFSTLIGSEIYIKYNDLDFFQFNDPIEIELREKDFLDIFYYSIDNFENKSSVAVYRLEKSSSSGDLIQGVSDNKIYNKGRVVWKANKSRKIRYEVAIDDNEPANVTVFSPELTDPIVFDSAQGETLTVSLNVKEFNENSILQGNTDKNYKFVIDKTNPVLPVFEGILANGYYQKNLDLKFNNDDSVYYKITSDINTLYPLDYTKYSSAVKIITPEGSYENFKIEAYSQDNAGNRSSINKLEFVIDKAKIYVSVNGKDGNNGSRITPFKTIKRALQYSELSGRNIINLTEGEFLLDETIALKGKITITGGFTLRGWDKGRGETSISISRSFPVNSPMFSILSKNISIQNISFSNQNLNSSLFNIKNGGLLLDNIHILHENIKNKNSIILDNSNLIFNNSELVFGSIDEGNLISSNNSSINFNNSTIRGKGISKNITIFNLKKSKLDLDSLDFLPGLTQKLELIRADNSELVINNTNLDTGLSSISTNMFILENTKLNMENTTINSISQSRILSCFNSKDSSLSINNSNFDLNAESGISFIKIDNSSIELSNSSIITNTTNEFSYFLKGNTSIVNFSSNKISMLSSDIIEGFNLSNSVSLFHNNNFTFEGGTTVFNSFNFSSPLNVEFVSNTIKSNNLSWISSENQATFIIKGLKQNVSLIDNNINGWKSVLNYNGDYVHTPGELNSFRGFMDIPEGNYSKAD